MRKCIVCGMDIPDGYTSCNVCGTPIMQNDTPTATEKEDTPNEPEEEDIHSEQVEPEEPGMELTPSNDQMPRTGFGPIPPQSFMNDEPAKISGSEGIASENQMIKPTFDPSIQQSVSEEEDRVVKKGKSKPLLIVMGVLLFLCVAGLGVGGYFFYDQSHKKKELEDEKSTLETSIQTLQTENANMKTTVEKLQKDKEAWDEEKETLNSTIKEKESEIKNIRAELNQANSDLQTEQDRASSLQSQVNDLNNNASKVTELYNQISQLDKPDGSYYSNRNVVILKKGESTSLTVRFVNNSKATVSYSSSNSSVATGKWDGSWFDNNNSSYLTITAGYTSGTSTLTFTNTVNSKSFQVLVIVTD